MDENEFRRLLKEQEDMREKIQVNRSKSDVVQIKINMEEVANQIEQMMNEGMDRENEFYFQKPKKTRKRAFWKKDEE